VCGSISLKASSNEKCFKQSCIENQNTCFMFNNFPQPPPPRKSRLLRDNVEHGRSKHATDDNVIRRRRIVCWITKATDIHSEYVILIAFIRQERLRERACVTFIGTLPVFFLAHFNSLKTKRILSNVKTQCVPRSKHSPPRFPLKTKRILI
jgi:hypothetical protein